LDGGVVFASGFVDASQASSVKFSIFPSSRVFVDQVNSAGGHNAAEMAD
jgi:hypothetical protein